MQAWNTITKRSCATIYLHMQNQKDARISWQIEEYSHREKTPDWYWALGIIAIAGAITAIICHDVLFAIIIVLGAISTGYYAAREPDVINVSIDEDGITIKGYVYEYSKLKGFAVEEHTMGNKLLLETSRAVIPQISISLPDEIEVEALRELLKTRIKEKNLTEPVGHRIMEHMGF